MMATEAARGAARLTLRASGDKWGRFHDSRPRVCLLTDRIQDFPADMTVSEKTLANAIRALSMDAVQAANSGHPGMPMGMADVATVLFKDVFMFDPSAAELAN